MPIRSASLTALEIEQSIFGSANDSVALFKWAIVKQRPTAEAAVIFAQTPLGAEVQQLLAINTDVQLPKLRPNADAYSNLLMLNGDASRTRELPR
jgi:hypothetical protein